MLCAEFPQVQFMDSSGLVHVLKAAAIIMTSEHFLDNFCGQPLFDC